MYQGSSSLKRATLETSKSSLDDFLLEIPEDYDTASRMQHAVRGVLSLMKACRLGTVLRWHFARGVPILKPFQRTSVATYIPRVPRVSRSAYDLDGDPSYRRLR